MGDLRRGTTFACFHIVGKVLVQIDKFIIWASAGPISSATIFTVSYDQF